MYSFMVLIHVLSAVGLGYYLIFPFLLNRAFQLGQPGEAGYLISMNRFGQYILVIALLSGSYLESHAELSALWLRLLTVLLMIMFVMTSMIHMRLKAFTAGNGTDALRKRLRTFSIINALSLLLIVVLMVFRYQV